MFDQTNYSEDQEFILIEKEMISTNKELILKKGLKNDNNYDSNENYSYVNLGISISKQLGVIVLNQAIASIRFLLLFVFSRDKEKAFLMGVAAIIPLYSIFANNVPWATVQYMGFLVSYYFGKGEPKNIGLIINKSLLYNLIISIIILLTFFFILPPILSNIFTNEETISVIYKVSRLMSIALPFQFLQFILKFYFLSIKQLAHLLYPQLLAFILQIILQCIIILGYNNHILGVGISYGMGQLLVVLYNSYFFFYKNNNSKSVIKFKFSETFDGFFDYILKAFPIGLIVFLNFISIELLQFLSILDGANTFTAYSILTNFFSLLQTFNKSLSVANNMEINRAKGQNRYQFYKRIIFVSLFIVTTYSLIISIVLGFGLKSFMSLYTSNVTILNIVGSLRVLFVFMFFTNSYIFLFSESLSCFGNAEIPLLNLLIFRFIGTISLAFIFYYSSVGVISFMLSFVINNVFLVICNGYYLNKTVDEFIKKTKDKK